MNIKPIQQFLCNLLVWLGVVITCFTAKGQVLTPTATGTASVAATINSRPNLALASLGAAAFASSQLGANYGAVNVNDGIINDSGFSWIPLNTASTQYVAVAFASPITLSTVVFQGQAGYTGRSGGTWLLQYTTDAAVSGSSTWKQIGTYVYTEASCSTPMARTCFTLASILGVTGVRLVCSNAACGAQMCVQELEAYGPPAALTCLAQGDYVTGAVMGRTNLALASLGTVAFASSSVSSSYLPGLVNDGIADGSSNSWVANTVNDGEYVGVAFPSPITLGAVVWDGYYWSRSSATWTLMYTRDAVPATSTNWVQIGYYIYNGACLPEYTAMPRTYFEFGSISNVTGIRLVGSKVTCGTGISVTELEAYAPSPPALVPLAVGTAPVASAINGRANVALASGGATAFASSQLNTTYGPANINNGIINDSGFSWIALDATNTQNVGVAFSSPVVLGAAVWQGQAGYAGRSSGNWTLQYTTNTPASSSTAWSTIGNYTYVEFGCASPMPRTYFGFPGITNVTGIRLVCASAYCGMQLCVQELEAYAAVGAGPAITVQPVGASLGVGDDYTLSVTAPQATSAVWRKDGIAIGNATTTSLGLNNVQTSDAGSYTVVLSNTFGSVTSSPAILTVANVPVYAGYTNAILADAPLHYYPLNESSGTTALDWGSSKQNGTYMGGCLLNQLGPNTQLGASVHFDGASKTYVNLGTFNVGNAVTVECWAKLDYAARTDYNSILARWDGSFQLDVAGSSSINWLAYNAAGTLAVAIANNVSRGTWHHLAGVYTNGLATVFVDGVESSSQIAAGVLRNLGPTPDRVLIGASANGTNGSFNFKGYINQVAFYNRALGASKVRAHYNAGVGTPTDLMADTWVATDALGRTLPGNADCGSPRTNKLVGIFYFLWHDPNQSIGLNAGGDPTKWDNTRYLAAHPLTNAQNPWADNPIWQNQTPLTMFYWGQPALDYYTATDPWVLRRNVALLTAAGVDVLIFDTSNGFTYDAARDALCATIEQMKLEGFKTNLKIAYYTINGSPQEITYLYNTFYSQNRYSDLWLYWQGKPMVIGYQSQNEYPTFANVSSPSAVLNFFTWRKPDAWTWTTGVDQWPYIDKTTPQAYGFHDSPDKVEYVDATCGGWGTENIGHSFTNGIQPAINNQHDPVGGTQGQGMFFKQQMNYALKDDPQFLYITGWNEWAAGVLYAGTNGGGSFLGLTIPPNGYCFMDEYNDEYDRDIEPMAGGHTDNYYYQMVGHIRQFKGARPVPAASAPQSINLGGDFSDWSSVGPDYYDRANETQPRNWISSVVTNYPVLTNNSGRNDFTLLKVARDSDYLYFYAQCNSNITSRTGSNWMVLLIDADQNHATGWEGYDYAVNLGGAGAGTTTLSRNTSLSDGWVWSAVRNDIPYTLSGNQLMLRVPRTDVGLTNEPIHFDFHWADNFQTNDIADFGVSGDSAPDRRFNYRYQAAATTPVTLAQDGFESGVQPLWSGLLASGGKWALTPAASYAGNNCVQCSIATGTASNYLATSALDTSSQGSLQVSFQYKLQNVRNAQNLNLQYRGTNGWVTIRSLGKDLYYPTGQAWGYDERQNVWLRFTDVRLNSGTNGQFFNATFAVRIDGTSVNSANQSVWLDDFLVTGVPVVTNHPPVLAAITNQNLTAGQWLRITNSATDLDSPPQTLTYNLLNGPTGMGLDPLSGVLTWRPGIGQSPASNGIVVSVADNGVPGLSATQSFSVLVSQPLNPVLSGSQVTNGQFSLLISGSSGPDYIVQTTTNLANPMWKGVATNVSAILPWLFVDPAATNLNQQFYRVLLGP